MKLQNLFGNSQIGAHHHHFQQNKFQIQNHHLYFFVVLTFYIIPLAFNLCYYLFNF